MSGFSNPLSFKRVDDIQIDEVQKFVKEKHGALKSRFNDNSVNLFGQMYASNPECFEFMPGERILIMEIAAYVRRIVDCGGTNNGIEHFKNTIPNTLTGDKTQPVETQTIQQFTNSHFLLGKLIEHANKNATRKKGGHRYENIIKRFSSYFRMIAGPLAYETIRRNLEHSLPSLSSVNRYMRSANCHIVEGVSRSQELLLYLKDRNFPLVVTLSEDLTRIIGRPQYCSVTNQIIGFVLPTNRANGMPIPYFSQLEMLTEYMDILQKEMPLRAI